MGAVMCQAGMSAFLVQVSGHLIKEKADPRYIVGAKGPRFCDEPRIVRYGVSTE